MQRLNSLTTWTAAALAAVVVSDQANAEITQSNSGLDGPVAIDFQDAAPGIQTGLEWQAATGISFEAVLIYSDPTASVAGAEGTQLVGEAGAEVVAIAFDMPQSAYSMVWSTNPGVSEVSVFLDGVLLEQAQVPTTSVNDETAFLIVDGLTFDRIEIEITPERPITNAFVIDSVKVATASPAMGSSYCTSTPNSRSAQGAAITATGNESLGERLLTLRADNVPDGVGLFLFGPAQTTTPLGGGNLCVGGPLVRMPLMAASNGTLEYAVDFATYGNALEGWGTVHFQAWFRDASAGGAGSNLSNALQVTFVP